jgi:hypothetical protein
MLQAERSPYPGVPLHLDQPLRDWLRAALDLDSGLAQRVTLILNIPNVLDMGDGPVAYPPAQVLLEHSDEQQLLDAVDTVLGLGVTARPGFVSRPPSLAERFGWHVEELRQILNDGRSVYEVSDTGRSLQRRVDKVVREAATKAAASAQAAGRPEAARDLAVAWQAAYGLHPKPSESYRLSIRAVEDVSIPLLLPANPRATLGTVRGHLRDAPGTWQLAIDAAGTDPLLAMINLLWTGQTDRHAGQATLERVDQAAAEMAVHLAAILVQWFACGHVRPTP